MSLDRWIETYYPTRADAVPESEALDHSIRKWEGLQLHVLEQHGLVKHDRDIEDLSLAKDRSFSVSGDTCALCTYYRYDHYDDDELSDQRCTKCPLYAALNKKPCDLGADSPYAVWTSTGDPVPMIAALASAKRLELAKKATEKEGGDNP